MTKEERENRIREAVRTALSTGATWQSEFIFSMMNRHRESESESRATASALEHIGKIKDIGSIDDATLIDACLAHAGLSAPEEEQPQGPFRPGERVRVVFPDCDYKDRYVGCEGTLENIMGIWGDKGPHGLVEFGECSRWIQLHCLVRVSDPPSERLYTAAEVREIAERAALLAAVIANTASHRSNIYKTDYSKEVGSIASKGAPHLLAIQGFADDDIAARAVALAMPEAKEGE